jgi:DDE family transposase
MVMDRPSKSVLERMPLAEGVLLLWRWVASPVRLQGIWDRFRGRCYKKVLTFAVMVRLIADALLQRNGSGRRSFEKAKEKETLPCTVSAAFKKLARLPVAVSQAFLCECTAALRETFPMTSERELPKSLREFQPCILDGKAIKDVAKLLKPLRGSTAGLLGGRALVAMDWKTGMAVCMHAHPDGDANDVRFMPDLLPVVRQHIAGPRLYVADRAFCDLTQPDRFTEVDGDHFLVRYHSKTPFFPDPKRPARHGVDEHGRKFTEDWGWLGSEANKKRREMRRIVLQRTDKESIILVTDLLDADRYAAVDLLWLYAERVGIEYLFQEVTEVFGLQGLISTSPPGCIFQFAFCMLLYNMIQVVRAYVAQGQEKKVETISAEKLFDDVKRELIAWNIMFDEAATLAYFETEPTLADMTDRLGKLLGQSWSATWEKAPKRRNRPKSPAKIHRGRTHNSVYRILKEYKESGTGGP